MARTNIGDIQAFADAVAANQKSPDLSHYLMTLDLTGDERKEVASEFARWNAVVQQPTDSPIPNIVDRWI